MKFILMFFCLIITANTGIAQKFKTDKYGYVDGNLFRELIKERNYQLVSAFDTVRVKDKIMLLATVVKNDKFYNIDLGGNETPYYDENGARIKEREVRARHVREQYYKVLNNFDKRFTLFKAGGKYGLIKTNTRDTILKPIYQSIWCYQDDLIIIKEDGKMGVIDVKGDVVVKCEYDGLEPCMVDTIDIKFFVGYKKSLATLVTLNGKELFTPKYNFITPFFTQGFLECTLFNNGETLVGLISKDGEVLTEPQYTDLTLISKSNLFRTNITGNNKYGIVSNKGKIIFDPILDYVSLSGDDGLVAFGKNKKHGFVDTDGKLSISPIYDHAECFGRDKLVVVANEILVGGITDMKYGMIDFKGKELLPIEYDRLTEIDGAFLAKKNKKFYGIGIDGKIKVTFNCRDMRYAYHNQIIAANENGLFGVTDINQHVIIPFKYSAIERTGGLYFLTPAGIIDVENKIVLAVRGVKTNYTNNLPLRKNGIFVFTGSNGKPVCNDRYQNQYIASY